MPGLAQLAASMVVAIFLFACSKGPHPQSPLPIEAKALADQACLCMDKDRDKQCVIDAQKKFIAWSRAHKKDPVTQSEGTQIDAAGKRLSGCINKIVGKGATRSP
jgi:hypothetical protein